MLTHQRARGLVVAVGTPPPDRLMRSRQEIHRLASTLAAALAAPLASGGTPLTLREIPLGAALAARGEDALPIAQGGERLHPQVDPGLFPRWAAAAARGPRRRRWPHASRPPLWTW
jgi:hypothetical protein